LANVALSGAEISSYTFRVTRGQKRITQEPISGYRLFINELRSALEVEKSDGLWMRRSDALLDGAAGQELRRLVDLPTRRKWGAFFTGSGLSERMLGESKFDLNSDFIYDPTVGAGDLLLAAARRLPLKRTLASTIRAWGKCLAGTDIHQEFVEAALLRVALLAKQRHGGRGNLPNNLEAEFPFIRVGDGMTAKDLYSRTTYLLMNPPFCLTMSPKGCAWAGGKVSAAAIFVINALELIPFGAKVLAILPDVLRSGTFQNLWRRAVSQLADIRKIENCGIFDGAADVDVFILDAVASRFERNDNKSWPEHLPLGTTVADFFDVHVGRVVPHRDEEEGPVHPYIHPRCVPVWTEISRFTEHRRYAGLVYEPPFVVLRRTSRPGHPYRAAASIIQSKKSVAVENHLIVCLPKDKSIETCRSLMRYLKSESVNEFLDRRIRCRHLTTGAVNSIPFNLK